MIFSLTTIQFSETRNVCNKDTSGYFAMVWPSCFCWVCFDQIQTLYFSMIHATGPFNSLGWFLSTFYWPLYSFHTPEAYVIDIWWYFAVVWTSFFVLAVLTITKHYLSQKCMPIDRWTSLGWFISSPHCWPSSFYILEVHVVDTTG